MWSDALLTAERSHLRLLTVWGAGSVIVGTLLLALLAVRSARSPLLSHFAMQTAAWGAIDLVLVLLAWRGLAGRDYESFTRLDRLLWLNAGLDAGYIAVGITIAVAAWTLGRRLGGVGAGIGIVVQGLALLFLDARFISVLNRLLIPR